MAAPILRALRDIVRKAQAAKKTASLCGEMASKPLGALALIALGYRSLSLSATAHGPVKAMLLELDARKAEAVIMPLLDAPSGRLIAVIPNRRGVWTRTDNTPFGHGRPYSRAQITQLLRQTWFTPAAWGEALFLPPVGNSWFLRSALAWP